MKIIRGGGDVLKIRVWWGIGEDTPPTHTPHVSFESYGVTREILVPTSARNGTATPYTMTPSTLPTTPVLTSLVISIPFMIVVNCRILSYIVIFVNLFIFFHVTAYIQ